MVAAPAPPGVVEPYVLCVDDDPEFLKSLELFLPDAIRREMPGNLGVRFLFLHDPREALEVLGELSEGPETVAMIISDQKMPHMTGTEFLTEARTIVPDAVRVLLTGNSEMVSAIDAINDRLLDKYLTKPIEDVNDFAVTIRHLLDRHRMQGLIGAQNRVILEQVRELTDANADLQREIEVRKRTEEALRNSEDQLRQSQKMDALGRLAGGISHDFNNILTTIIGRSELVARSLNETDPLRDRIEEIRRGASRAADLTQQLLAFSRRQVLEPKVLDLNEVVAGMEKMLRCVIPENIEFRSVKARDLGRVMGDPGQIGQVAMNLVINARDAMPDGGRLTIETADVILDDAFAGSCAGVAPGRYVMLAVTDTGCGIDETTRRRIFEPFFTTKAPNRGTGLGLSTVYGIVRQSGGHVEVDSEPGKGASFRVYLPRAEETATTAAREGESADSYTGSEVVLLVEDDTDVRALARDILEDAGYTVLEASNGGDAVRRCEEREGAIDLMITDVVMPRISGPEAYRGISRLRAGLKVLYMSGYADDEVLARGVHEGAGFIQKPFTPDGLVRKVRATLDAAAS